jgi:hypothetical protein
MPSALASRPARLAFVGQGTFFEACSLGPGDHGFATTFVEFRGGAEPGPLREALDAFDPDVVVVFRPEIIPAGLFGGLRARTVGFLTEPLPRTGAGAPKHDDLERRLWELGHVDRTNFDRIVAFDPHIAKTADAVLPVWRALPLPVHDAFYAPVRPAPPQGPRTVFVGRSTEHRERLLKEAKDRHELLHLAFGVGFEHLLEVMAAHEVTINIHNNPYPSFENRVCLHLAAGHLVLSEELSPTHGLEPDIDFLVFETAGQLADVLNALRRQPDAFHKVRVRGRRKAELFRASRVYPRLVRDLEADLAAFGSPRG